VVGEQLEGDDAFRDEGVLGAPHSTHRAFTELGLETVVADRPADHGVLDGR